MTTLSAEVGSAEVVRGTRASRTRLLFVSITFHPEPGAMRGLPLAKELMATGDYDVVVLTAFPWYPLGRTYPGYKQRLWQWEEIDGVRVLRVPIYPSHDASAVRRILTYVSFMFSSLLIGLPLVGKARVVFHVDNLPTTGLVSLLYGWLRGAPVVQHVGDLWPESVMASGMLRTGIVSRGVGRILRRVCDFVYGRNALITVLSEGFRRILSARGIPADRIRVIYNWAEEDHFHPTRRDEDLARSLGFGDKFNIVYAGNVGPLQALETVVRAAELERNDPDLQFVIIGEGPRIHAVRSLAHSLKLTNVLFLPRQPITRMNAINAISDVLLVHLADQQFLHTTIPSKVQVAFASGRPVLLGVRGDAAEMVLAAGAGKTFLPEDAADLARAAREMKSLPAGSLRDMGGRGRAYYDAKLSLKVGTERMREVFNAVTGGRSE